MIGFGPKQVFVIEAHLEGYLGGINATLDLGPMITQKCLFFLFFFKSSYTGGNITITKLQLFICFQERAAAQTQQKSAFQTMAYVNRTMPFSALFIVFILFKNK